MLRGFGRWLVVGEKRSNDIQMIGMIEQAHENIRKINTHENGYKIKNGAYIICLFV